MVPTLIIRTARTFVRRHSAERRESFEEILEFRREVDRGIFADRERRGRASGPSYYGWRTGTLAQAVRL
jgi:hypothetical protein